METFGKINLIHGDCMDYLRSLPDNAFSLTCVDPPYSDGKLHDNQQVIEEIGGVRRSGGSWFTKYQRKIQPLRQQGQPIRAVQAEFAAALRAGSEGTGGIYPPPTVYGRI
jgi:predicted methyltransferase